MIKPKLPSVRQRDNFAQITRRHCPIDLVIDTFVDELHRSIGKSEMGAAAQKNKAAAKEKGMGYYKQCMAG